MNEFFRSCINFYREAAFNTVLFWAFPICTILLIWLLTTVGLKLFSKRERLKTVFVISRAWMISALLVAAILVGFICYWWATNFFMNHPWQLSLLLSLLVAMLVPIISLTRLRRYYTKEDIKELVEQPKTKNQLDTAITKARKAFDKNKYYYLLPAIGFLLLLLYLNKGSNLIAFVFDNSDSMTELNAKSALSETVDNLEENNEITLTTLDGPTYKPKENAKGSIAEIMQAKRSSELHAGNIQAFQNPAEAMNAIDQIRGIVCCSPISESIWKTYLFLKENKPAENYRNKLLIVITDGADNYVSETLKTGKFFSNDEGFSEYFPSNDVFVIDYSGDSTYPFMQRCDAADFDVYKAENSKQAYLDALDNALESFRNNWYLIYWTIAIVALFTIIGLLIQPKKIV